jgi:uncharacterized protein
MNKGVDSQGFIINPCDKKNIQDIYAKLVKESCREIIRKFPEKIHSLYIYGSVGRGEAVEEKSDLDMVVLFHQGPSTLKKNDLKDLSKLLIDKHPIVPKVDFDIGSVEEVMAEGQKLFWQFFLKHCCSCIYGTDITLNFSRVKPTKELSERLNHGFESKIDSILEHTTPDNIAEQGKALGKQILRSAYLLTIEQNQSYYNDIPSCVTALLKCHPSLKNEIDIALDLIENKNTSMIKINKLVKTLGRWVIENTSY